MRGIAIFAAALLCACLTIGQTPGKSVVPAPRKATDKSATKKPAVVSAQGSTAGKGSAPSPKANATKPLTAKASNVKAVPLKAVPAKAVPAKANAVSKTGGAKSAAANSASGAAKSAARTGSRTTPSVTPSASGKALPPKHVATRAAPHYAQQQPGPERYREIQQALADKGYFRGPVDGTWGPDSMDALKRFQTDQNVDADGKISALSLIALGLGPRRDAAASRPVPPAASTSNSTELAPPATVP